MEKRYFTPVAFDNNIEVQLAEQLPEPTFPDITEQLKLVREDLALITQGRHECVRHAIHFGDKPHPFLSALKTLEEAPNLDNLKEFLLMVKQDVNRRVAQKFATFFGHIDPKLKDML